MSRSFEAEIQQHDNLTYVRISGRLDEDNELLTLSGRIRGETAIIDLSAISEINNCGIRDWVRWLDDVQARCAKVALVECSPAIVAQLNQVSNFSGRAFVKSFYVPYFCQACDVEKSILIDMDEIQGRDTIKAPTCRCDGCDGVMAFDDLEESYFAFVKEARRRRLPEALSLLLDQLAPTGGERKILSGVDVTGSSFTGIPSSTSSVSDYGTFGGSTSVPSAGALRRLRDKTGMRTTRRASSTGENPMPRSSRLLLLIGAAGILAGAVVTVLILLLR